jgi:hypothetical protein
MEENCYLVGIIGCLKIIVMRIIPRRNVGDLGIFITGTSFTFFKPKVPTIGKVLSIIDVKC